jgi:hypothetical protein
MQTSTLTSTDLTSSRQDERVQCVKRMELECLCCDSKLLRESGAEASCWWHLLGAILVYFVWLLVT